jgi:hypothetical protein
MLDLARLGVAEVIALGGLQRAQRLQRRRREVRLERQRHERAPTRQRRRC